MTPRDLGPGFHDHDAFLAFPFLAALLVMLALLTAAALYLARSGKLELGRSGRARPEEDAKRVLAERFARGDIDGQEFMERSSLLNWTPGVQEARPRPRLPRLRG